jgi:UDP-glucose 4-epimerase
MQEHGMDVHGIDWVPNKWKPEIDRVTTQIDLRDKELLMKADLPKNIDAIIHLAANARVYDLVEDPDRALDNVATTYNVLEFARQRGIKKFMFSSSREAYGNAGKEVYSEDMASIAQTESPYSASKIAGEAFVESYTRCYGVDHVIFRFSNVYGMYDDSNRVIPLFLRLAKKNEQMTVFGKDKKLDFTYIDDTVAGILQCLEAFATTKNQTYNLAFGEGTTIEHLAKRILELTGSTSEIKMAESRVGEVFRYIADISKAKKAFGYSPKTSFEEGIKKTVEWYGKYA